MLKITLVAIIVVSITSLPIFVLGLVAGRFDYLLESKDSINYIMKKEFFNNIDAIEPVLPVYEIDRIFLVFSKKNPNGQQISDDFDKGIKVIQESGIYEEILKNHGIR